MSRKYWTLGVGIAGAALVTALALSGVSVHPQTVANAAAPGTSDAATTLPPVLIGQYVWSYAAKFVCGYQSAFPATGTQLAGEPLVKPGNYATDITIHNANYRDVKVFKKVLLLADYRGPTPVQPRIVREPESVGPVVTETIGLGPDFATQDDCNRLYVWTAPSSGLPAFPPPLIIGYLVILSPVELDVDTTYTAVAPGATVQNTPTQPTGISIEEERVTGKRVFIGPNVAIP